MAWFGEVQPAPIPTKPIPVVCFTHTCTVNPWVLGNTAGTVPINLYWYFIIFPF